MKKNIQRLGKSFFIIVAVSVLLFQSGCGFKDIDKRIFVLSIGVDHTDNEERPYRVILKLAVPSGSIKQSGTEYTYLVGESESFSTAIRNLKTQTDKELDFGHAKVIVFGEDILHHELEEIMDFFLRRRDIQLVSWVAIGQPSAENVLKAEPESEMAGSHALFNLFDQNGVESPLVVTTYLFDFRRRVLERGIDPILPVLFANEDKKRIDVNRAIVVNGNKKRVELNPKQTTIYNLLSNNSKRFDVRVKNDDLNFTVAIDTSNVHFHINTETKQKPIIKMDIEMVGIIQEADVYTDSSKLQTYSKATSKTIEEDVLEVLKKFLEEGVDPLGFGVRYKATRLHNNKRNEEWQELYPKVTFEVNAKASLKSTGVIE
ncbi:Ger(x)C family spore germination protein [Mesobacillus maritimus]|uniref:Ger(x)C family spore germination protein n=1 Tax=Mesobacillus maritimus TaxID=1643336 RepID=UPI00384A7331